MQIKNVYKDITSNEKIQISSATKTITSTWSFFLKNNVRWKNAIILVVLHVIAIYGFTTFPYFERYKTVLYSKFYFILSSQSNNNYHYLINFVTVQFMIMFSGFGVTCGAHRFWSHRSFSAKLPLRILLATCFISASQVYFHELKLQIFSINKKILINLKFMKFFEYRLILSSDN
jgi:hypothetical protein